LVTAEDSRANQLLHKEAHEVFNTKIRTAIVGLVASGSLAAAFLAPAVSQAEDNAGPTGAKGCAVYHVDTGTSEEVKDGTVIITAGGSLAECRDGKWVTVPGRVRAGSVSLRGVGVSPAAARTP
jgi:hypothetical protein